MSIIKALDAHHRKEPRVNLTKNNLRNAVNELVITAKARGFLPPSLRGLLESKHT